MVIYEKIYIMKATYPFAGYFFIVLILALAEEIKRVFIRKAI